MRPNWGRSPGEERRFGVRISWYGIPVVKGILIATVACFLLLVLSGPARGVVLENVALLFATEQPWYHRPWTLLTYPLAEMPAGVLGVLWVLISLLILFQFGGSLERAWGSANFLVFFLAITLLQGLAFLAPYLLFQRTFPLAGLFIVNSALVTAWAALDPHMEVSFWGVPMRASVLAAFWVGLVYVQYAWSTADPLLSLLCLASPAAAWIYVRKLPRLNLGFPRHRRRDNRKPVARPLLREEGTSPGTRERVTGFNPLRRRQEQQEIERLRRLLGEDDDDPGRPVFH